VLSTNNEFNDTQKPLNFIPEFKDLQKKKIMDKNLPKDTVDEEFVFGVKKQGRDSEEFRDTNLGFYNKKKEKEVKEKSKKRPMKKKRIEKLLGKSTDNLDVAVIPI